MGAIYCVKCDKCGVKFEHYAGVGFSCSCRDCGEFSDENSQFRCPVCGRLFRPQSPEFGAVVEQVTKWD